MNIFHVNPALHIETNTGPKLSKIVVMAWSEMATNMVSIGFHAKSYTRKSPVNTDLAKTKCCPFLCILSDVEAENGHCRRNSSRSPKELKFIWPILMVTSYTEQGHT